MSWNCSVKRSNTRSITPFIFNFNISAFQRGSNYGIYAVCTSIWPESLCEVWELKGKILSGEVDDSFGQRSADGNEKENWDFVWIFGDCAAVTNVLSCFLLEEIPRLEVVWTTCHCCIFPLVPLNLLLNSFSSCFGCIMHFSLYHFPWCWMETTLSFLQ